MASSDHRTRTPSSMGRQLSSCSEASFLSVDFYNLCESGGSGDEDGVREAVQPYRFEPIT